MSIIFMLIQIIKFYAYIITLNIDILCMLDLHKLTAIQYLEESTL